MKVLREVETKLAVPQGFVLPRLTDVKGVDRAAIRTLRLRAVYYDTDDLLLARSGTTLRHRTGEGRPVWTLKLGTASRNGLDREELSVPGSGRAVPLALLDLLTAYLRGTRLLAVVQLKSLRTSHLLFDRDGQELADVVDDVVDVVRDGELVSSWRELEVEQRSGSRATADRVIAALREAGAVLADQTPKAVRALGPAAQIPAHDPVPQPVRSKDLTAALVSRSLAVGLADLVRHDLGVRRGQDDAVHQLRVACRRLRTELRAYRDFLDDPRAAELRGELSWLAASLGAARDTEVLRDRLRLTAVEDPLSILDVTSLDLLLAGLERSATEQALTSLRTDRYLSLLQLLHKVAVDPGLGPLADTPCWEVLPALVDAAWSRLTKRARGLALDSPDAAWHRARILAKRARYVSESAGEILGQDRRARAAKRLQTDLGVHQDAVVAADRYLLLAAEHPELAVTCARLAERERAHVRQTREAFLSRNARQPRGST